jgi:transcriptional regulator with XRE-family HTH domain
MPQDAAPQLGAKLRRRRKELGLTQAELGGSRLSKGYISLIETGRVTPSEEALSYLASRLRRPVSFFCAEAADLADAMRTHLAAGQAHIRQGRHAEAGESLRLAARLAMDSADGHELALAHESVGHLYLVLGDLAAAEFAYRESLTLFREVGASEAAAACNCHLLNCALVQGNSEAAEAEYIAAITQLESDQAPGAPLCGRAWLAGGFVALVRGFHREALRRLEAASGAFGAQDLAGAGETQLAMGILAASRCAWAEAQIHLERAVGLLESVADPRVVAIGVRHLVDALVELGLLERAEETVRRLGAMCAGAADDHSLAWAVIRLADLSVRLGDIDTAKHAAKEAGALLEALAQSRPDCPAQSRPDAAARQQLPAGLWHGSRLLLLEVMAARVSAAICLAEGDCDAALGHLDRGERLAAAAPAALALRLRLLCDQVRVLSSTQRYREASSTADRVASAAELALRAAPLPPMDYEEYGRIPSPLWFRTPQ